MLSSTIRTDMVAAMKAKEADKVRTLRSVLAAIQEAETSGKVDGPLSDAEVEKVLAAQVKRRVEAAEGFASADRPEQAAAERAEQEILEHYLPEGLSDDELETLIDKVFVENGFGAGDMGPAMKAVNAEVAGRADGRKVADWVKARLN